jgi:ubiquinone biosynthesis protein UbiJ
VAEFLSAQWFDDLNENLRHAEPLPLDASSKTFRVVLEFVEGPSSLPHAITFTMSADGASLCAGDHLAADALVSLTYADALALTEGRFDSASALREGRVKVRGDINAIVPLLSWLQLAHPHAEK